MALGGLLCSTLLDPRHFPPESSSHFSVTPALMRLSPWRLPPPGDSGLVPCVALLIPASWWPQRPSWGRHTKRVWQEGRKGRGWPWGRGREGHATESPEFSHEPSGPTAPQSPELEPSTALVLPGALLTSETHGAGRRRSSSESLLYPEKSADLLLLVRHHS